MRTKPPGIAKGAAWMLATQFVHRLLDFGTILVLARLLLPEDFGLIALAVSVALLIELCTSMRIDMALIQRLDLDKNHYNSAFSLNLVLKAVSCGCLLLTAPVIAEVIQEPRLGPVLACLAVGILVQGAENPGIIQFRRELDFRRDFQFQLACKSVSVILTLVLAFLWRDYWSMIAGLLSLRVSRVFFSFRMHPFRPKFTFLRVGELVRFSKWILGKDLLTHVNNQLDDILVGRWTGMSTLGHYSMGYNLSNAPTTELVFPVNQALFAGYSRLGKDIQALRGYFIGTLSLTATVVIPISVAIATLAPDLTVVLLGPAWMPAVPFLQLFAVGGLLRAIASTSGPVFNALGKPYIGTCFAGGRAVLLVPLLVWGIQRSGAQGAAKVQVALSLLSFLAAFLVLRKVLQFSAWDFLHSIWRPALAGVVMMSVLLTIAPMGWGSASPAWNLILDLFLGGAAFLLTVIGLWLGAGRPKGVERSVIGFVQNVVAASRRRR